MGMLFSNRRKKITKENNFRQADTDKTNESDFRQADTDKIVEICVPCHVRWNSISFGGGEMGCGEADEIIEEIMTIFISKKLTVEVAKRILSETISSIDKEFVLEKRKIGDEII